MSIRKFFFLFTILFSTVINAQEAKIDSLITKIENHKKSDTTRVKLLNELSKYYTTTDISKNESVLLEAISISKAIKYSNGLAKSYLNYSVLNTQQGQYDKALEYALKSRFIQDSLNDNEGLMLSNSTLAQIYIQLKKPKKAIELQLENLQFYQLDSLNPSKARIHFYLATAYSDIKNYNEAAKHYNSAKNIAQKTNFLTGVHIANSSLGVLARKQGNPNKSIYYLETALAYYKQNGQFANIAHTNIELALSYADIEDFDKAIFHNKKAIDIYRKQNNKKTLRNAYLNQSDYYKSKNDIDNSYKFYKLYSQLKDSLYSIEKVNAIEEMQAKYETKKIKKEKETAEQQAEIAKLETQRNKYLLISVCIITLLILVASLFYLNRLKAKKKAEVTLVELKETQKRLALEKQYRDTELKALKAQMNPHFIFNALNSIQEYILLNQKDLASDYLGKFADLIRTYLNHSDAGYISIAEEVDSLNLYLELEKLRFEDKLSYTITVDKNINTESHSIPTMFIQPYVENALKHGLLHKKDNRKLDISFKQEADSVIECVIIDNGVGRAKSQIINSKKQRLHKSFALKASKNRLELLNEKTGHKIGVEIEDLFINEEASGTKVTLKIPLIKL